MTSTPVYKVLSAFSRVFQSIDLRIVAVDDGKQLTNLVSSIFACTESPEGLRDRHKKLEGSLPSSGEVVVLLYSLPFPKFDSIFSQFRKGRFMSGDIGFDGLPINFSELDLTRLAIDRYHAEHFKCIGEWKILGGSVDAKRDASIFEIADRQNEDARRKGFGDIYEWINQSLEIRFIRGHSTALVVGIPILAKITGLDLDGSSLKVAIRKASLFDDLQLNFSIGRLSSMQRTYEPFWVGIEQLEKCEQPSQHEYCDVTSIINLPNFKPHDRIAVELIHLKAPSLCLDIKTSEVPLEKAYEPFAKVLTSFCPFEKYKMHLFSPEESSKPKPSDVFEDATAWLLSLIGYSVIQLRGYEILRATKTKYQKGSVDMIAYRENEDLLLVDCDTSVPDEKKIQSMKRITKEFSGLQDQQDSPRILSLIISPRDCGTLATEMLSSSLSFRIVGRHKLEKIFEEAMTGNSKEARSILINW